MRVVSFARGGVMMSQRIFSYRFTDNIDYDLYFGAKFNAGGSYME